MNNNNEEMSEGDHWFEEFVKSYIDDFLRWEEANGGANPNIAVRKNHLTRFLCMHNPANERNDMTQLSERYLQRHPDIAQIAEDNALLAMPPEDAAEVIADQTMKRIGAAIKEAEYT